MGPPLLLGLSLLAAALTSADQYTVPVGYDAYIHWDQWPLQRIGVRAYMRSTYDRAGGNEGADASHFLYEEGGTFYPLDISGPGMLVFARFNHWHGSPWTFEVDHKPYRVQETSTSNPNAPDRDSTFLPASAFPKPLAFTWSTTHGADLSWVPMEFLRSFRIGYGRTHYGTGYFIFDRFAFEPANPKTTRQPVSWNPAIEPPKAVTKLLSHSGDDLTPGLGVTQTGLTELKPNEVKTLWRQARQGVVRLIEIDIPEDQAESIEQCSLGLRWDGRNAPSVNAPVPLFFGAGTLFNRSGGRWMVKAFPVSIQTRNGRTLLRCQFPMPFFRSAQLTLKAGTTPVHGLRWRIRTEPFRGDPRLSGYFHATYKDHGPNPPGGKDLALLDTKGVEGSGSWSGSFIGTSFIFSDRAELGTLEGDPRFFFDDSQTPQAQGTGTEEWCGGGDYWGGQNMTLPLAGHPTGAPNRSTAVNSRDEIESAYRFLLADSMPFGKRAVIQLEHGGVDESREHYRTLAYWYGLPAASLVKTDQLDIGWPKSEASHSYGAAGASQPYELESLYEWGPNDFGGQVVYPAHRERVRTIQQWSEFTIRLDPENRGVLLRRQLDYGYPNQRAEVYVSKANGAPKWEKAGTWYLAGSNSCLYSNPAGELDPADPKIETGNRRFRDDEFLISKSLTNGRSHVRLRIAVLPVRRPLYSNGPQPVSAWTEIRYSAYCFVIPVFHVPPVTPRRQRTAG